MTDPRADLERLPSDKLFDIARNECAQHRVLAIRLRVERRSRLALQPEIIDEARALKLIDPAVIDSFRGKLDIDAQIAVLRAEHATDRLRRINGWRCGTIPVAEADGLVSQNRSCRSR